MKKPAPCFFKSGATKAHESTIKERSCLDKTDIIFRSGLSKIDNKSLGLDYPTDNEGMTFSITRKNRLETRVYYVV